MPDMKKFFNKYPYTDFHELNLDWVIEETQECVDIVTTYNDRLTAAEGNITNLQGRMTTAESNITNVRSRMTTAEGNITSLQGDMQTAQSDIASLQSGLLGTQQDVDTLEQDLNRLTEDVGGLDDDVDALDTRVTAIETTLTRTGAPIEWTSTKGTIPAQEGGSIYKYGKIRNLYIKTGLDNISVAIPSCLGSAPGDSNLIMETTLPPDSEPMENMQVLVPIQLYVSPYVGHLILKIGTDRSVKLYNATTIPFNTGEDTSTFEFSFTYFIS